MDPNETVLPRGVSRMSSAQTFPITKINYNPATKFISMTKKPPKKLLSTPIKNPRIVIFRTPKQPAKPPVHVNLMKRFNHLSNEAKENVQFPNETIRLSDQSNLIIKLMNNSPVEIKKQTDTLEALAKRGISVTPLNPDSAVVQNGNFIQLGSEVTLQSINPGIAKLFKCPNCPKYFVTKQNLSNHEKDVHQQKTHDFGIPVVDFSKEESRQKLISLGIEHYVPITNIDQNEGCSNFGIPILSVQGSANSTVSNILAMGANGILSLGPFKKIHK